MEIVPNNLTIVDFTNWTFLQNWTVLPSYFFLNLRLKNVAIQHVNKSDLPSKMMDRDLQSKYVREVYSMNNYSANPKIDVDTFIHDLADKLPESAFYDHRTKQALTGMSSNWYF